MFSIELTAVFIALVIAIICLGLAFFALARRIEKGETITRGLTQSLATAHVELRRIEGRHDIIDRQRRMMRAAGDAIEAGARHGSS